ncbi:hypothetical protein PEBR_31628 [Penicillium brasilianum]|uniref:Uncharacterized protein n=1 Tax=Penicillium brasilianum TaxID=104259 RepID=A0A1S9RF91_PENBI|nr:hypothetical protein PEBR_31628 [Penicillium brasilianum]
MALFRPKEEILPDNVDHYGEIPAYLVPNDLRYPGLILNTVKAGYCMFLSSPRNSIAAHKDLFETLALLASPTQLSKAVHGMCTPAYVLLRCASLTFIDISANVTCIIPTAAGLPTASALVEAMKHTPMDMTTLVPSIVRELAQEPELLDYCAQFLEYCFYIGGDPPHVIGDKFEAKIKVYNHDGSSKVGKSFPPTALLRMDMQTVKHH